MCVCVFFCFGGVPCSYLHPRPHATSLLQLLWHFFPLWTNGVPTMSTLPTTYIILFFIFFPWHQEEFMLYQNTQRKWIKIKYISRVPTLVVGKLKVSTFNKGRYSIGRHTILGRGGGGDLGTYAHHPLVLLRIPPMGVLEWWVLCLLWNI
jgi:hypothetical protein